MIDRIYLSDNLLIHPNADKTQNWSVIKIKQSESTKSSNSVVHLENSLKFTVLLRKMSKYGRKNIVKAHHACGG